MTPHDHTRPIDDPNLTAYALGELDDDASTAMRQRILGDDEANAYVRDVRDAADTLRAALDEELNCEAIVTPASGANSASEPQRSVKWVIHLLAAVLIFAFTAALLLPSLGSARKRARKVAPSTPIATLIAADGDIFFNDGPALRNDHILFVRRADNDPAHNTETYDAITDNPFTRVADHPLSTFSIDVDTASYANTRRFIREGRLPPAGAVRIEELVNYFSYSYPSPDGQHPVAAHVEVAGCPWTPGHQLVRIGLQAKRIEAKERPAGNLVFLLDVSGSMAEPNKLPLVKESMRLLVGELDERDRVAIVVYAGASGLALSSTPATRKGEILAAIDRLTPGGSTAGAAGIELAYRIASENLVKGGINRVILATDGDFNIGVTDRSELVRMIETHRDTGVFLSILGFGMGNYKDSTMEELSNKGNGNYAYIDTRSEARKALVEQLAGTLVTVAKDVKVQVEFNPAAVASYRLIGYENRMLAKEDFNDDKKDAGEVGAGHSVTALYEIVPVGAPGAGADERDAAAIRARIQAIDTEITNIKQFMQRARMTKQGYDARMKLIADLEAERAELARKLGTPEVDPLKYQKPAEPRPDADPAELMMLKLRYKPADGDTSVKLQQPVRDPGAGASWDRASGDFRFAASVAAFGMILRDSPHKGAATLNDVATWASQAAGDNAADPYRAEFIELVGLARSLPRAGR